MLKIVWKLGNLQDFQTFEEANFVKTPTQPQLNST